MVEIPDVALGEAIVSAIEYLRINYTIVFDIIRTIIQSIVNFFSTIMYAIPPVGLIAIISLIAWRTAGMKVAIFAFLSLLLTLSMGHWPATVDTLALVFTATLIALVFGIPLGIWKARSRRFEVTIEPVLDFMQTLPSLSYLIPAVLFFRIGEVPGVVATVIFSMPPAIRLTALGIEQVSEEKLEVGKAFGATSKQILMWIELPLAMPSIMMGINQTIMLAFSMVVIAGFIGSGGLGEVIISGIQRYSLAPALEAGLVVVFLAIILDRITKRIGKQYKPG